MTEACVAVYRLLLRLMPGEFRRAHGEESVALFRRMVEEKAAAKEWGAVWRTVRSGWWGVVVGAWDERRERRRMTGRGGVMVRWSVKQAVRSVRRAPGLSLGVVLLLGLGVGATTTVFSVVDGVMIRDLPYPDPDRLVMISEGAHSWPDVEDWQRTVPAFESIAAATGVTLTLSEDVPEEIEGARIGAGFLGMLGARTARGRLPSDTEYREGRRVGVLGHAAWERRWGGDEGVVGSTLPVNGESVEVIGVLSEDFVEPAVLTGSGIDLWVPLDPADPDLDRHSRSFSALARLAPGATLDAAGEQLAARARAFAAEHPDLYAEDDGSPTRTFPPVGLGEATVGDAGVPLLVLLGGAVLLLLVACGNAASLLLARGTARRGELAVRRALGGGSNHITVQLLIEAMLLATLGGALGLGLAFLGVELARAFEPGDLPRATELALDVRAAAGALAIALGAGLITGAVPAWRAARVSPGLALRQAERGSRGRLFGAGGRGLVTAEAALASVLVLGSLLVLRAVETLSAIEPGFDPEGAWAVSIDVGRELDEAQRADAAQAIRKHLAGLTGVEAVGAGLNLPFEVSGGRRCCWRGSLRIGSEELDAVWVHPVTPGYFSALKAPLREGREFTTDDALRSPTPIVVNRTALDSLLGGSSPPLPETSVVGRTAWFGERELAVVGVVEDLHHWGAEQPVEPEMYVPYAADGTWASSLGFAVRTPRLPSLERLRQEVAAVAPRAIVQEVRPMDAVLKSSLARPRFYSLVLGGFAASALLLAAGGLAGALLFDTRRRGHELGIRMALGAPSQGLVAGLVFRAAATVVAGAVVGWLAIWPVRSRLDAIVPGVDPWDPLALLGFAGVLLVAALGASWIPARVMAGTDPARVLR